MSSAKEMNKLSLHFNSKMYYIENAKSGQSGSG
jgi:hypothetical protein